MEDIMKLLLMCCITTPLFGALAKEITVPAKPDSSDEITITIHETHHHRPRTPELRPMTTDRSVSPIAPLPPIKGNKNNCTPRKIAAITGLITAIGGTIGTLIGLLVNYANQ